MKKCPYCAEDIQDAAIKCKHCKEFLDHEAKARLKDDGTPWYFKKISIIIALCCVGPLALPMVWFRPRTSMVWKTGITMLVLALTWLMYLIMVKSFAIFMESIRAIQEL